MNETRIVLSISYDIHTTTMCAKFNQMKYSCAFTKNKEILDAAMDSTQAMKRARCEAPLTNIWNIGIVSKATQLWSTGIMRTGAIGLHRCVSQIVVSGGQGPLKLRASK